VCVVAVVALLAVPAYAKHKKHKPPPPTPGVFDYYVMSLAWSPQYCAGGSTGASDPQCGTSRHYGFVLHGLWPQYQHGYPQSCSTTPVGDAVVDGIVDIMPSPQLVRHEWSKHGTCSGLTPEAYFNTARTAYAGVKIPGTYTDLKTVLHASVPDIEQAFHGANPDLDASKMAVLCSGKFLQEVRVCLDNDLHARDCGPDVRNGCKGTFTVRPMK